MWFETSFNKKTRKKKLWTVLLFIYQITSHTSRFSVGLRFPSITAGQTDPKLNPEVAPIDPLCIQSVRIGRKRKAVRGAQQTSFYRGGHSQRSKTSDAVSEGAGAERATTQGNGMRKGSWFGLGRFQSQYQRCRFSLASLSRANLFNSEWDQTSVHVSPFVGNNAHLSH